MAMAHINVPNALPGLFNTSTMFGGPPMSHGRAFCQQFYGNFPDARHCQYAIRHLPAGDQEVTYIADGRQGLYNLPQTKQSGTSTL